MSLTNTCAQCVSHDALRSLGHLTKLRLLDISLSSLMPGHIKPIENLTNLEVLKIIALSPADRPSAEDMQALASLTKLTHLQLSFDKMLPVAMAVSGLSNLQHWDLATLEECNRRFEICDYRMASLEMLTDLTSLVTGSIWLDEPTPGYLPGVRSLCLVPERLVPTVLLETILPLLPLPSLTHLSSCRQAAGLLTIDVGCIFPFHREEQALA